jgi:hypothetical protein
MHTTNVYAKAYLGPDVRVDFIGPDGRPVQNMVNRVPVPPETMSAFAVSYRAKLDKFAADPKNAGREPTPEEREKMIREAQEDPVIRRLEASQAATAKREDVRYQQQQLEKVQTRNDARIKAVLDPLDKQRQNMQMLASLTNVSDPKARQAALAITPVELISAITGMKRFNKPEVDQIINSMGGIEKFVQKIRHYIGQEGTVPSDVGNAVNKLTELMQRDLDRQQRIIDRYNTENNTINDPTRDRARAANLVDRMNRELNETPQEELKRLEEEQKRRQGAK